MVNVNEGKETEMERSLAILLGVVCISVQGFNGAAAEVHRYGVFETALQSSRDYNNPFTDVDVKVTFSAPSGATALVYGFWDGGKTWRARFSPNEIGLWRWKSESTDPSNAGLHGKSGEFRCVAYKGDNVIYLRGPLKVSDNGRYFVHADGTPFLWLGDTAWGGILEAKADEWERYLTKRREAGINLIQVAATHWRGTSPDPAKAPYTLDNGIRLNVDHFREADKRFEAISRHGYVTASVLLWGGGKNHPIDHIPEEDAFRLARYIYSRWSAHNVIWLLAGDGDYRGEKSERWKRLGNYLFGESKQSLVTMHPGGLGWVRSEFVNEPWYDFIGYQSGHGDAVTHLEWLLKGPPSKDWTKDPVRPFVNLEPNYEAHMSYHKRVRHSPHNVRRSFYWSMLVSPAAGYTYGHTSIWPWRQTADANDPESLTWEQALDAEGAACLRYAKALFGVIPWWKLVPDQDLLAEQPGAEVPDKYVAAARTESGDLALIHMPVGGELKLKTGALTRNAVAKWFNPRTGKWQVAGKIAGSEMTFQAPDNSDWVLCIK